MGEVPKSENKNKSKFYEASLLIFLYFLQGLICGILLDTMQMNLKLNFSYKEIGIFLMCSYPFSLKIFWSPIVDTYYIKSLGLRKTWIIFTQSISALILIYLGYTLDDMLADKNIYTLSIVSFLLMLCIATQDIAVDGWALSLCGNDSGSLASSCQAIGQMIGIAVSTSMYVYLHHFKVISLSGFFLVMSKMFIIGTVILFFIKETDDNVEESGTSSIVETLKNIKIMASNKNLRKFIGIILLSNLGNIFFHNVLNLVLIEKGLTQEMLTNVSTLLIPLEIYLSFYLSSTKEFFLRKYMNASKKLIFVFILQLLFLVSYDFIKPYDEVFNGALIFTLIFSLSLIKTIYCMECFSGLGGFFHKISDSKIGATYITALNSFNNLAHKWPGLVIFTLVDYFGYTIVGVLSIIYCIFYYLLSRESFTELEELNVEDWKIKISDNENKIK